MAYPATGRTKEDDDVVFSFVDDNSQVDKQAEALERNFFFFALGARRGRRFHATNGLPGGGNNERRRRRFQLFLTTLQAEADKQKHSSAIFFLHSALGAEDVSTTQIASDKETQKETLNVLLLHEMTRIRNVRLNSKHFPTIKVDFLSNNVVLRT